MRRLRFESLENRDLMAGNVTVSRTEIGDLLIAGDSAANVFALVQTGATMYQITGDQGTSINGRSVQQVVNVTGSILINTGAGDDQVTIGSMTSALPTRIHGELNVKTGAGVDRVQLFNVTGGIATIQTGSNAEDEVDRVNVRSSAFVNLSLATGGGNDVIESVNSQFTSNLAVDAGSGNDLATFTNLNVRHFNANLGTGNDKLILTGKFKASGRVNVDGGVGDDLVNAIDATVTDLDVLSGQFSSFEIKRK